MTNLVPVDTVGRVSRPPLIVVLVAVAINLFKFIADEFESHPV